MFKQLVILTLCSGTFVLLNLFEYKLNLGKQASLSATRVAEQREKKTGTTPFIYLTQTEQCLPSKLTQNLELSNRSNCRCDVIVLSYKKECREESPFHFTYLFDNTTTWGPGRNELFFRAMEKRMTYIYYIFLDDDVSLKFSAAATPAMTRLSPILVFQNWLLDYEPAVGIVDYNCVKRVKLFLGEEERFVTPDNAWPTPLSPLPPYFSVLLLMHSTQRR